MLCGRNLFKMKFVVILFLIAMASWASARPSGLEQGKSLGKLREYLLEEIRRDSEERCNQETGCDQNPNLACQDPYNTGSYYCLPIIEPPAQKRNMLSDLTDLLDLLEEDD